MKVMTVVGTRPEIIRISRVIEVLDGCCDHVLVHTGQNRDYELNQIFFEDLGIRPPDVFLDAADATPAKTIANIIARTDDALVERAPDALLVLGDTNSCLAAYPAKRRKVPIFHMEAGNRCFDQRVPEEINRKIVDHIADINLPYSAISRDYLLREGFPPDRIIRTGSPMAEVIHHHMARIEASDVLGRMGLEPRGYFLVSAHREENIDPPGQVERLAAILNGLAKDHGKRVIVTTHPRTRKAFEAKGTVLSSSVLLAKPFPFTEYVRLELGADRADRRVDPHGPGGETAEELQRAHDADEPVPAHPESAGVVEEDDPGRGARLDRRRQQRADDRVVPPRLADDRLAEPVLARQQEVPPVGHGAAFGRRPALDDRPRGLALGVRVHDLDAVGPVLHRGFPADMPSHC